MLCLEKPCRRSRDVPRFEHMARRLLSLAGVKPDASAICLIARSVPRNMAQSDAGPDPRKSPCAFFLCAAEARPLADEGYCEFVELVDYFLEEVPLWSSSRKKRLLRSLMGE